MNSLQKVFYRLTFFGLILSISVLMMHSESDLGEHTFNSQDKDQLSNYGDNYIQGVMSELK